MSADYFLDIDGIKGEAKDSKHKDKIEVLSWSWSESQSGSASSGGGAGSGKVSMNDFSFMMNTNIGSPDLLLSCATGKHIAKAQLTCRKAGEKQQEYLKIYFTDLLISSYQIGGSGGGGASLPVDQITFNFSTVKMEYAPQDAKGGLGTPVIRGYDLKQQKSL